MLYARQKENNWVDYLTEAVYVRLCECRNKRADLKPMAKAMWKWEKENATGKTKEEVVDKILEWVGDWNSQVSVADISDDEYKNLLECLK